MAQQPASYVDISQSDFEKIDGIVRKLFEPLKKGDVKEFKKLFLKHCSPALQNVDALSGAVEYDQNTFGNTRDVKYVRHESITNVTDYYLFYYADLRETSVAPWEFKFYRTKEEWKIAGFRTDPQSPVDFFKFSALQYKSFTK